MNVQSDLKSYSDVRRLVDDTAFRNALSYMSWHNRLAMTEMLECWQALVVAMLYEKKSVDGLLFPNVKAWLDKNAKPAPLTVEECRGLSESLHVHLFPL